MVDYIWFIAGCIVGYFVAAMVVLLEDYFKAKNNGDDDLGFWGDWY